MNLIDVEKYNTICVKIKINIGHLEKVYQWKEHLILNKQEVLTSLQQEGVFIESVFLDTSGSDNCLIYYMKFMNAEKSRKAFDNSELAIDKYHKQFKEESWGERIELEQLVDFVNAEL